MSQQNVEIVRTAIEAFNRRDLNTLANLSSDDLELVSAATAADLGGAAYRGTDAWVDYFAAMDESWEDWRIEDFEVLDARDDRVVCRFRLVGRGQDSGVPVERAVGITYRLLDARLWRINSYLEPGEAARTVAPENGPDELDESDTRVSRRGFFAGWRGARDHFRE